MKLLQLCWEDQNRLLFKFQKEQEDRKIIPENIKSINLKFELAKVHERASHIIQQPFLVSIKDIHFAASIIFFSVDLERLTDFEDLQIKVIRLTIFFHSGGRDEIFINKSFHLSEITYDEGEFLEITEEELIYEEKTRYSVKTKKVSKNKKSDREKSSKTKKISHSRNIQRYSNRQQTECSIPLSEAEYLRWLELKGDKTWDTTLFEIRKAYKKFNDLELEVKELNSVIKQIALNSSKAPKSPMYLQAPASTPTHPSNLNPPTSSGPPEVNSKYSLNQENAKKVFRDQKDPNSLKGQIAVMREMKEKFEKITDVKELLLKVPEEEVSKTRAKTDHLGFLEFKQKKIDEERNKKIERLKELGFEKEVEDLTIEQLEDQIEILLAKEKLLEDNREQSEE
ncbi:MAG: hypothetical protein GF317_03195 [Candidatus Lokiarchaeota archaeon]|nr:hypothetical protein [Candidatus Lokiarchaeota archaeon]MBD3198914.1 hypothetical protein [Candidatus Lokiarchaeota archaeon]